MADSDLVYSVWVTARVAADLPGQWVAHCLDFDVVSQGDSLEHAVSMIAEAASLVVEEDAKVHRDPLSRRAPESEYDELWEMVENGDRVSQADAFADHSGEYIYAFRLQVPRALAKEARPSIASAKPRPRIAFAKHVAS